MEPEAGFIVAYRAHIDENVRGLRFDHEWDARVCVSSMVTMGISAYFWEEGQDPEFEQALLEKTKEDTQ